MDFERNEPKTEVIMQQEWIVTNSAKEMESIPEENRQPCEVWTRVMGYHRPVSSFNIGKKGEHEERRFFREEIVV